MPKGYAAAFRWNLGKAREHKRRIAPAYTRPSVKNRYVNPHYRRGLQADTKVAIWITIGAAIAIVIIKM